MNSSKQKTLNKYKKELAQMTTDSNIRSYFGPNVKIVKESDMDRYNSINDLLTEPNDMAFVLQESQHNQGHWVLLLRYNNIVEFFDSYGKPIDFELSFIPRSILNLLHENNKPLSRMFRNKDKGQTVIYNKEKLQRDSPAIDTCGRWAILRAKLNQMGYSLDETIGFINRQHKEQGLPLDIMVCNWIVLNKPLEEKQETII